MISETTVPLADAARGSRDYLRGLVIDPDITLNEVAALIYRSADGQRTVQEIAAVVTSQYDTSLSECLPDVVRVVEELVSYGALHVSTDG